MRERIRMSGVNKKPAKQNQAKRTNRSHKRAKQTSAVRCYHILTQSIKTNLTLPKPIKKPKTNRSIGKKKSSEKTDKSNNPLERADRIRRVQNVKRKTEQTQPAKTPQRRNNKANRNGAKLTTKTNEMGPYGRAK